METVLNLLWLALALTALAHWITRARSDSPEHSKALRLTALVMLLVLLFPVISLTDDLQASAALAESERAGTRISPNDAHPVPPATPALAFWNAVIVRPTAQRLAMTMEVSPLRPSAAVIPYALVERPPPPRDISRLLNS